jgi:hypothetical protein
MIIPTKTKNSSDTDANLCRLNGWKVGTRIRGRECGRQVTLTITAIGEHCILAKSRGDGESEWDLTCREWREVK